MRIAAARWVSFLAVPICLLAPLAGVVLAGESPAESRPPNVVFLLIDDLGWTDLGCYGSSFYETPNVDRLAAAGMKFTDAYAACAVCSPTRASILTGKYPARLHLTNWLPGVEPDMPLALATPTWCHQMGLEEVSIAEALRAAGYATAHVGKWHVGGEAYYPEHQGFDRNIGGSDQGTPGHYFFPYEGWWRPRADSPRSEWVRRRTLSGGSPGEYLTDRLTDEALRFIEENRDRPFFLHLAHYAVHTPIQAKSEKIAKYQRKPKAGSPHGHPGYAAMVESVDESVGRVLDRLQFLDLESNTIVFFYSDNGGLLGVTSNTPLRAGKVHYYEGGIRVPLIVRWPDVVEPGSTCGVPVTSTDFFPTILDVAALSPMPRQCVDGESLVPLLKQTGPLRRDAIFWHYPHYNDRLDRGNARTMVRPSGAVRQGNFKLIERYEDGRLELYDLAQDLGERRNLAADMPDRARTMQKLLADWRRSVGAQMPQRTPQRAPEAKKP